MTKLTVAFRNFSKAHKKKKLNTLTNVTFTWDSFETQEVLQYIFRKAASLHGKDVRIATFTQSVINCLGFFFRYVRKNKKRWMWPCRTYGRATNANKVVVKNLKGKKYLGKPKHRRADNTTLRKEKYDF